MKNRVKLVPPDGGWGWVVVLGSSLMNLSTRSIEPSFGLLFGDVFKDMGIATSGAAVIVSTFDAIINFSGLFVGPLIKKYSFRTVGFLGAFLSTAGLMSTSYAGSMAHLLFTYSIICGIGFGLAQASTFVALNSYFLKRRGQAVGLAMTGTAVGFITMPQLIRYMLEEYGFHDTMLLMGALCLHAVVGAALLQPVEWHMKSVESNIQEMKKISEKGENNASKSLLGITQKNSASSSVHQNGGSNVTVTKSSVLHHNSSTSSFVGSRRKTSTISNVSNLDFMGSTIHVELETDSENEDHVCESKDNVRTNDIGHCCNNSSTVKKSDVNKSPEGCWDRFANLMDLDLLLDIRFLNILFGLSIAYVAELNFKLIVPFFLENLGFSKREIAKALTFMAIADLTARVVTPPINDRLGYSRRNTLLVGLIFVSVARSAVAEQTSWRNIVISLIIHGFFRGFSLINFPLVVSEAVVIEKYPTAFGLSMVAKGIFIVALGPISGWFRDYTESYSLSLHLQSATMVSCVIAWLIEYFISFSRKRTKETINIELS